MNILIIKNFNHIHTGWDYLTKYFQKIIHKQFPHSSVEIMNISYTSVWSSSYYFYTYKNIDLKNKYDLIFVCEGKPCKKWIKNGHVVWIPCQEFIGGGPWNFVINEENNWYSILSPSKYLYDKIKKKNKSLDIEYIQIWDEPPEISYKYNYKKNTNENINLFLHFKTRNWGTRFWTEFLKDINCYLPNIDFTIKVDNHSDIDLSNINLNNIKNCILGNLKSKKPYIESLCKSDIYITPRIMEGIGICPQEAAFTRNVIIGTDISTHNEYFSKKNGLIIKCDILRKNDSKNIMGEKKTILPSIFSKNEIIDYIKFLDNNREWLEKTKEYNQKYAIEHYEKFLKEFTQYISNKISSNCVYIYKKKKITHIQTCLEGGQGLISTLIAQGLERYSNYSNDFYYISNNDYKNAIDSYKERLGKIKYYKSLNYKDIDILNSDIIFFHWSSSAAKRIPEYHSYTEWIKNLKIPTVGLIYDSIEKMPDVCDYYCVPSRFNVNFSPNINRTFIVPYQVEDDFYNYLEKDNSYNKKYSPFVIGRISRIIKRKFHPRYNYICKYLYSKFPQISFSIIGDGNYYHSLNNNFKSMNIPYKIEKDLYRKDRIEIMRNSDLCLYITGEHEESFCLSIAEYMALGIPVICENKGALKEVVGDGGCVCDSIHDIINKFENVILDCKLRKELSKKAKQKVLEYKNENISKKYIDIINFILEKKND